MSASREVIMRSCNNELLQCDFGLQFGLLHEIFLSLRCIFEAHYAVVLYISVVIALL